jgi:hypothetical protein
LWIKEGGKTIVTVHKNWATPIKDAYFIDIDEDCDDTALALMVVIGLEHMTNDNWIVDGTKRGEGGQHTNM